MFVIPEETQFVFVQRVLDWLPTNVHVLALEKVNF